VHVLVAAAGAAVSRFDDLARAAGAGTEFRRTGWRVPILGGIVGASDIVAGATRESDRLSAAVLGSPVHARGTAVADAVLSHAAADARTALHGLPDDLVALVIDQNARTLTLASGTGNHRWFVAEIDRGVLAATQVRPLAVALGADLELDRSFEDFLLGFGFLPDGRTAYEGVRALPAGEVRIIPGQERAHVDPAIEPVDIDPSDHAGVRKHLHDAFFAALERQAGTDRRHAVLLGGFDSALVAAGLRRLGHEVDCYTFAFGDSVYEQRDAELIASSIGATHTWVHFTPDVVGDLLLRFDEVMNQPSVQPHYQLHTVHASTVIASDGHTHIFNGDGCDAAFLGYPTVSQRARLVERLGMVPAPVQRAALRMLGAPATERRFGHVARTGRSFLRSLDLAPHVRGHLPSQYLDAAALARLRRGDAPRQAESVAATRQRLAAPVAHLDRTRLAFHGNGLTGQSKAKVEGAVTTSGLAQFSPYLEPGVKALAAALPAEMLRPAGSKAGAPGKAVLIDMVREHELLPERVIALPKQSPSDSPIDGWYAGPLRVVVDELLAGLPFEYDQAYVSEILAPKRVEELFRRRVSISHHAFQAIGLLCSYAAFTRRR
jgi:asparagine synthetase B (glutamine-hydrolysing)